MENAPSVQCRMGATVTLVDAILNLRGSCYTASARERLLPPRGGTHLEVTKESDQDNDWNRHAQEQKQN